MDTYYELEHLAAKAKANPKLRQQLINTKNDTDPLKSFCELCRANGYNNITLYAMATAGEEFCAAMLRSVNGGGTEAPNNWDDFYEAFIEQLKSM